MSSVASSALGQGGGGASPASGLVLLGFEAADQDSPLDLETNRGWVYQEPQLMMTDTQDGDGYFRVGGDSVIAPQVQIPFGGNTRLISF